MARRSCSVGCDQSSFSSRTRPSGVDVDDDRVHRLDVEPHQTPAAAEARCASSTPSTIVAVGLPSDAAAVGVLDVDAGVADQLQRRRKRARRVRNRGDDHVALGHLMMVIAQHRGGVNVVVDDQPQLTAGLEPSAWTLTRSFESRRQTPASAPGLLARRRESSIRIMRRRVCTDEDAEEQDERARQRRTNGRRETATEAAKEPGGSPLCLWRPRGPPQRAGRPVRRAP